MKAAYKRIEDLDKQLHGGAMPEVSPITPYQAIRLGLGIGLAIAQSLSEIAGAIDDLARELKS